MAKTTSRKGAAAKAESPVTEVDIVEEAPGMGWEGAVAVLTALMLFVAIILVDYSMGRDYGTGVFFK
jgi:hypothetical protein